MSEDRVTLLGGPRDGDEIEVPPGVFAVVFTGLAEPQAPARIIGSDRHGPIFEPVGIVSGRYLLAPDRLSATWQGWEGER